VTTLREIRRRLQSVGNVEKITKAMERVAAAKLKKAQEHVERARPYAAKIKEVIENLVSSDISNPLFEKRNVKKTGVVIFAPDKGLCGSYASQLLAKADHFLSHYKKNQAALVLIGKKAIENYAKKGWEILLEKEGWGGKITLSEIQSLTDLLVDQFLKHQLDEVWLIYTEYITVFNRKVVIEKFLNIDKPTAKTAVKNYIFEPNQEEIINALLPRFCLTRIQAGLHEAYASELAARIVAMRMASKNSEEMIEKLTVVLNKARQTSITRQMIEISSGGER
jgi:F-type H+-transporting ATPase subunit gamma